jgi:LacI family transcriptional regulator/LacI family repressor for deo operon, udp, cdd, tsx, nupC, and nupG
VRYHSIVREWKSIGVGIAIIGLTEAERHFAGIDERSHVIGRVAAEFLVAMVERGDRGVPENPQRILVEGHWCEGRSAPRT